MVEKLDILVVWDLGFISALLRLALDSLSTKSRKRAKITDNLHSKQIKIEHLKNR